MEVVSESELVSSRLEQMNSLQSCRVQCVCVCVSCGGFCLAPVPASILGRGCGCVARAGSRCPGAGRVTAVVGCQDDERPSGTQGAAPRWRAGTCHRSRARQNCDKSLKEPDSRAQHHAPEDAVRERHIRIPASLTHGGQMHPVQNYTQTSLKLAMHFSFRFYCSEAAL